MGNQHVENVALTHVITTQVWLQLSGQDLERSAFADTVRPDESKHLAWSWCRQSMQLERVRRVTMCDLGLEIGGEVDDGDSFEWTPNKARSSAYIEEIDH